MAKLTIGEKAQRVLRFLMGMRTPGVIAALSKHGFTEADLRSGVERLGAVTRTRLKASSITQDPTLIDKLDEFENRWFQIVRATLDHHYPHVSGPFFSNLVQTSGVECAISVGTFIERLAGLEAGTYGPDGAAARALLAQRGLTDERVAEAKALVDAISAFVDGDSEGQATAAEKEAVERDLWAWYLEWSVIARAVIEDRRMLRALGFRKNRLGSVEDEVDEAGAAAATPSAALLPASTEGNSAGSNTSAERATAA
jgi:hypothetical protein